MTPTNINDKSCDSLTNYINKMSNSEINGNCAGVYIGTNEEGTQKTFEKLVDCSLIPQSCHIGFSSWFNFDIIFKRKSSRAVLIDFNPHTKIFLKETLHTLMTSHSRNEFSNRISKYIAQNISHFSPNINMEFEYSPYPKDDVFVELKIPGNWLNSDEGFNYIKKMAQEGKIAIITENICAHEKMKRIASIIQENGYVIDTLYISNIAKYMDTEQSRVLFTESVNHLSNSNTKIIHVPENAIFAGGDLIQQVIEVNQLQSDGELKIGKQLLFPNPVLSFRSQVRTPSANPSHGLATPPLPSGSKNKSACSFQMVVAAVVSVAFLYLYIA